MTKLAKFELNVPSVVVNGPALEIGEMGRAGFEELGLKLRTVEGFNQFWIGDWANAVVEQHSDTTLRELCELIGLSYRTVRTYGSVAGRVDVSRRLDIIHKYPDLTFSHFQESVTAPSPEFALEKAGTEDWTILEMRKEVKAMHPEPETKDILFQWLRDRRVIKTQEAFLYIAEVIEDLQTTTEDHAIAAILLTTWSQKLHDLKGLIDE